MRTPCAALLVLLSCAHAQSPAAVSAAGADATAAAKPARPAWISRSDENARLLLDVRAQFEPEQAAHVGLTGLDEKVTDLAPGHRERLREALQKARAELQARASRETDPLVAQDLAILVRSADLDLRGSELTERLQVPSGYAARVIFSGVHGLLDPQIEASRRPAALVRLRRYTGLEPGTTPLTVRMEEEMREAMAKPGRARPSRIDLENQLQSTRVIVDGIGKLFAEYKLEAGEPLAKLAEQLDAHDAFVRREILPQAREDFRLPPELYAYLLERVGVDLPVDKLTALAHQSFTEIQGEMQKVAAQVARSRGLPDADYRAVIRELKKEQIPDDQVLAHYNARLADLEKIIRDHDLVTLPSRPARIRLGTPAENAQQPAPHMNPPRLIGNTGEQGEFVLPLSVPGKVDGKYDDFNFAAASWTLTAHEARPGHELQFATMVERGVSLARAIFAFNSVNAEGWGLYAESIALPYMSPEGQLISLQLRLQRAARAFVDPELQQGKWTPASAREFLQKEVGLSPAFASAEVDRYTFRAPAQATSYFYGYVRLLDLRREVEARGGFDARRFHDAVLAQGLLPPDLLRKALLQ